VNDEPKYHDENIRVTEKGISIRAPKRPFPWWGPFDACDAIGRFMVILVLSLLASITLSILSELVSLGSTPAIMSDALKDLSFAIITSIFILAMLMIPALGMLFRKKWSIVYIKVLLILISTFVVFTVVFNFFVREGDDFVIGACVMPAILIMWLGIALNLWLFLSDPHTLYYFSPVPLKKLEKNPFSTTKRMIIPILASAISVLTGISCFIVLPLTHPRRYSFSENAWPILWGSISVIAFLILAPAFLKRWKATRLIFLTDLVLLLIVTIITIGGLILITYVDRNIFGGPGFDRELQIDSLTIIIFFAPWLYIIFELFRYIRTDRFRAWCRLEKNYVPPWKKQIEAFRMGQEEEKTVE
jgi:hypothetical protein